MSLPLVGLWQFQTLWRDRSRIICAHKGESWTFWDSESKTKFCWYCLKIKGLLDSIFLSCCLSPVSLRTEANRRPGSYWKRPLVVCWCDHHTDISVWLSKPSSAHALQTQAILMTWLFSSQQLLSCVPVKIVVNPHLLSHFQPPCPQPYFKNPFSMKMGRNSYYQTTCPELNSSMYPFFFFISSFPKRVGTSYMRPRASPALSEEWFWWPAWAEMSGAHPALGDL